MQNVDVISLIRNSGKSREAIAEYAGCSVRSVYRWEKGESKMPKPVMEWLQQSFRDRFEIETGAPFFRFIDLFAGIGGLRMAFEDAGGKCVFTSEWNKYSVQTYLANFVTDHPVNGDITKIEAGEISAHDVLLAGFPCQPFSIAGVSKKNSLGRPHGFDCETQGTLFFDVERIIAKHRPAAFLLENVKNLTSHDKGRTFDVIHRTLRDKLGYEVHYGIIDAKRFVPQHRERIFIIGFREKTTFSFDEMLSTFPSVEHGPKLRSILHPENGSEQPDGRFTEGDMARVAAKYTLTEHLWNYLQEYARKHREKGNGFGFGLVGPDDTCRTLSARYYKDGSEILIRQEGHRPRRLTLRECARLMGFDRPGKEFVIPVSDTQAYKQFGNAVVVPVVRAIAQYMLPYILSVKTGNPDLVRTTPVSQLDLLAEVGA